MPTSFQIEKTKAIFMSHRLRVVKYMARLLGDLMERSAVHDESKMTPEEFEVYANHIDDFDKFQFGTPEYNALKEELKPATMHHFSRNRHHPEYFETGINEMNLADIVEMLCDWKAATQNAGGNGDLMKSISILSEKYGISPQLKQILINTAKDFGLE